MTTPVRFDRAFKREQDTFTHTVKDEDGKDIEVVTNVGGLFDHCRTVQEVQEAAQRIKLERVRPL